jgi:hypothetical protein
MRYECRCLASPVSGSVRPLAETVAGSGSQDHITLDEQLVPPDDPKRQRITALPRMAEKAPVSEQWNGLPLRTRLRQRDVSASTG